MGKEGEGGERGRGGGGGNWDRGGQNLKSVHSPEGSEHRTRFYVLFDHRLIILTVSH